jgi:[ribosomal protein S5]-alanine N-acetyltransferase
MRFLPETLSTSRLHLRRPVDDDARAIFRAYAQDLQVCRFMVWVPHSSESVTREFVAVCLAAWATGSSRAFVITELGGKEPIGMLEARLLGTTVDIGYVLAASHWGQGFMPEAVKSLTAAALQQREIFRVQATCDTENIPSQRTLEKAGFNREGRMERYTVHPNISAAPRACFMYAKCR